MATVEYEIRQIVISLTKLLPLYECKAIETISTHEKQNKTEQNSNKFKQNLIAKHQDKHFDKENSSKTKIPCQPKSGKSRVE